MCIAGQALDGSAHIKHPALSAASCAAGRVYGMMVPLVSADACIRCSSERACHEGARSRVC